LQSAIKNQQSSINQDEAEKKKRKIEDEFGDVVFSLINYARFLQIDAENAIELTNKKFTHRFIKMEQHA